MDKSTTPGSAQKQAEEPQPLPCEPFCVLVKELARKVASDDRMELKPMIWATGAWKIVKYYPLITFQLIVEAFLDLPF